MEEEHVPVKKINGLRVTSQSDMKLVSYALLNIVGENLVKNLTSRLLIAFNSCLILKKSFRLIS